MPFTLFSVGLPLCQVFDIWKYSCCRNNCVLFCKAWTLDGPLVSIVCDVLVREIDRGLYWCICRVVLIGWQCKLLNANRRLLTTIGQYNPNSYQSRVHSNTRFGRTLEQLNNWNKWSILQVCSVSCNLIGAHYQAKHRYYCRKAHNTLAFRLIKNLDQFRSRCRNILIKCIHV